jgi:hypothetical protein
MGTLDTAHLGVCALSGTAWAAFAAWRAPGGSAWGLGRGLAGGGAAFGLALAAYSLLEAAGLEIRWDRVLAGGWPAVLLAAQIGLVEEGAKLAGIALATTRPEGPGSVMRSTVAVSSAFAALEASVALSGADAGTAAARALLAPVAHAALAVPLGFAVAAMVRRGRLRWLGPGLLTAAALHGAGDLSLTVPGYGRLGYAAALLAPALAAYLHARRSQPGRAAPWAP